jgi:hypothetical protein
MDDRHITKGTVGATTTFGERAHRHHGEAPATVVERSVCWKMGLATRGGDAPVPLTSGMGSGFSFFIVIVF